MAGARPGIRVDSGSSNGDTTVFLEISGNTSGGSSGLAGIGLRKQGSVATVNELHVDGLTPTPATHAQMEAYVSSLNPGSALGTGNGGGPSKVVSLSGENYLGGSVPFLVAAAGGVEAASAPSSVSYVLADDDNDLTLTGSGDDNAKGNALDNVLTGNAGDNRLNGGNGGHDRLTGGDGVDTFV